MNIRNRKIRGLCVLLKFASVFLTRDESTSVKKASSSSFGENLNILTRDVFDVNSGDAD
jgi:hypothetical protein